MSDVWVASANRTVVGKYAGALSGVRPDDLAAAVLQDLAARVPGLDPAAVADVFLGCANQAGEDNRDVARMAVLLAGWPVTVPGATVNRLCGSGMEATIQAARAVRCGDADLAVAGGVESMSRAPWVLPKPEAPFPRLDAQLASTTLGWRLVNEAMDPTWTCSLGEGAEILADEFGITRQEQDEFAVASHRKAAAAWDAGFFDSHVVPLPDVELTRDECIRPDTSVEKLARLTPAFRREGGTVTAGNSSSLNDGAAALLVASDAGLAAAGVTAPLARIVSSGVGAVEPQRFGIGPVRAAERALAKAGLTWDDVDVVELNEAFAAQSIACLRSWPELDPAKVNVNGGAIAIGHPLGCSGARVIGAAAHELERRGGGVAVAALCIGVGQGLAVVLQR